MYFLKLYIFEVYRTVMHTLRFGKSQIITIILNNFQLVDTSHLYTIGNFYRNFPKHLTEVLFSYSFVKLR